MGWLANHCFSFSSALPRWLILFFSTFSISAYVWPVSVSKHESQPAPSVSFHIRPRTPGNSCLPNTVGPRLGTNLPSVRPWNVIGSWPGPAQYPNVHTACADLSSKPDSILCNSRGPRESMNHLLLVVG